MKTPIEVKDIRKGDLIRWESGELAHEFRTSVDEHGWDLRLGQHYLLDRPTPPVELPTEPTLGWIGQIEGGNHLGRFGDAGHDDETNAREFDASGDCVNTWYSVTAFTPAAAIPASALDELRHGFAQHLEPKTCVAWRAARTFLAAVDAANGDAS